MASDRNSILGLDVADFGSAHPQGRSHIRHSSQRLANNRLSMFLLFVVAAAPIPFGSNRPAFWAISAVLIALAALVYLAHLARVKARLRYPATRMPLLVGLFAIFLVFLIVQILPVGSFGFAGQAGNEIAHMPTLSISPGETLLMLMRQCGYALFFFLMLQVSVNRDRAESLLTSIFVVVVLYAVYAMVALTQLGDPLLFFEKTAYRGSATGTFINRNSFATFLAVGAVAGSALLFSRLAARKKMRGGMSGGNLLQGESLQLAMSAIAVTIIAGTLISTHSRMGAFSMCGGLAATGIVYGLKSEARLGRFLGAAAAVAVAGGSLVLILFGGGLFERIGQLQDSFDVRFALYRQVLEMVAARPLTGYGGGSFDVAYPLFHRPPVNPDLVWDKAHSTYLALWSELGLVFGSLPILIFVIMAAALLRRIFAGTGRVRPMEVAALGALVVVGLHSLFDFSLEIQANTYLLLAVVALGLARGRETEPSESDEAGVS